MDVLVGSTGLVGQNLQQVRDFGLAVHRANVHEIRGAKADLLVCAALPAAKWVANANPVADKRNAETLLSNLGKTHARRAVLISTIDVYSPPVDCDELDPPNQSQEEAYGANRAWFEIEFASIFPCCSVIRLPGLISKNLRKNLVYDLMNNRIDQLKKTNRNSTFQFMNLDNLGSIIETVLAYDTPILNIVSEPVTAGDVAKVFGYELGISAPVVAYNVMSRFVLADEDESERQLQSPQGGYQYSREEILNTLTELRRSPK